MTYKELKDRIRDLGFEDSEAITENIDLVVSGVNAAINTISVSVMPITENYVIEQQGTEKGLIRYKFKELTEEFVGFYKKPKMELEEELRVFNDYYIENNNVLILKGSFAGKLICGYKRKPTPITSKTADDFEIELDPVVHELVPLLAAYYIWLDDDNTKATQYQNLYDGLKNEIMGSSLDAATVKITGGVRWQN